MYTHLRGHFLRFYIYTFRIHSIHSQMKRTPTTSTKTHTHTRTQTHTHTHTRTHARTYTHTHTTTTNYYFLLAGLFLVYNKMTNLNCLFLPIWGCGCGCGCDVGCGVSRCVCGGCRGRVEGKIER